MLVYVARRQQGRIVKSERVCYSLRHWWTKFLVEIFGATRFWGSKLRYELRQDLIDRRPSLLTRHNISVTYMRPQWSTSSHARPCTAESSAILMTLPVVK
jgi:hypothetical protein